MITTQSIEVTDRSWPIGERGVGKLRLVPGNFYVIEIDAMQDDSVVATMPRHRVWVPWAHRASAPPVGGEPGSSSAFYDNIYFRTSANGSPLEERLPALIKDSPDMFETEYHRLGMAWLDLHKRKAGAVDKLQMLVRELPEGNVVRETAQSLIDGAASEQPVPRRLKLVGPEE